MMMMTWCDVSVALTHTLTQVPRPLPPSAAEAVIRGREIPVSDHKGGCDLVSIDSLSNLLFSRPGRVCGGYHIAGYRDGRSDDRDQLIYVGSACLRKTVHDVG